MDKSFGFIHEKIDIKILILFVLRRLPDPISFDTLTELVMCDGGIGYFDYAQCVAELVQTDHIKIKDGMYSATAKGARNGEATEKSLPFSVRMSAEKSTSVLRAAQGRDSMIKTVHLANPDGGYTVELSLSDGVGVIVSMELYATDEHQAAAMEKGFRKNAESVYHALIDKLLG